MMATKLPVSISDEAYVDVQKKVEVVSGLLLDPLMLGKPTLDLFIERGEQSLEIGPILHPSEFRVGADKLQEVLTCARALRDARDKIAEVADDGS